jgi:hypothetical protein
MAEGFRASASNESTSPGTDVSVTIPGTVQANDGLIAVWTAAGTESTITMSGWTLVGSGPIDKGTVLRAYVYKKYATAGDAGATLTVTRSNSNSVKRQLTVAAYSGVDQTDFIQDFASAVESSAGLTHAIPSVTATGSTNWRAAFVVDRGSPASSDWTPPASLSSERQQLIGSGTGTCSTDWADSGGTVAAGTYSGDVFTSASNSTANAIALGFIIKASTGTDATATPSTVAAAASIGTPDIGNGTDVTVHPATVVGTAVFQSLVGQVSSTMQPDTVAATTTITSPSEAAQQTEVVIPDLTVAGTTTIGTPTIVAEDNTPGGGGGDTPPPSGTRTFVGPTRTETWPLAPGARIAVTVVVNQTLYRKSGVWLVGENLNWADLEGVDRLYQGGATEALSDDQLDELVAEGQGQYVVGDTDPFASTFTGTF